MISYLNEAGVLARIPGHLPLQQILIVADSLLAAPLSAVVIECQDNAALSVLSDFRARVGYHMKVGVHDLSGGSINFADALAAGAQFFVSPRALPTDDRPFIPIVNSLEDAHLAYQAGWKLVMTTTTALRLSAWRIQMPGLRWVVAGPHEAKGVQRYVKAGVTAVAPQLWRDAEQTMPETIILARAYSKAWQIARRKVV